LSKWLGTKGNPAKAESLKGESIIGKSQQVRLERCASEPWMLDTLTARGISERLSTRSRRWVRKIGAKKLISRSRATCSARFRWVAWALACHRRDCRAGARVVDQDVQLAVGRFD